MASKRKKPAPPELHSVSEQERHIVAGAAGTRLAMDILEEEFGPTVQLVAQGLVALGSPTLAELRAHLVARGVASPLTGPVAKNPQRLNTALVVLMSQQLIVVTAERNLRKNSGSNSAAVIAAATDARSLRDRRRTKLSATDAAAGSAQAGDVELRALRYSLDVHRVLLRLRHPAYLSLTRQRFGWAGLAVATVLLRRGAATCPTVVTNAAKMLAKWTLAGAARDAVADGGGDGGGGGGDDCLRPALAQPTLNRRRGVPASVGLHDLAATLAADGAGDADGGGGAGADGAGPAGSDGGGTVAPSADVAVAAGSGGGGGGGAARPPTPAASPAADVEALEARRAAAGAGGAPDADAPAGDLTISHVTEAHARVTAAWEAMQRAQFLVAVGAGVGAGGALPPEVMAPARLAADAEARRARAQARSAAAATSKPTDVAAAAAVATAGAAAAAGGRLRAPQVVDSDDDADAELAATAAVARPAAPAAAVGSKRPRADSGASGVASVARGGGGGGGVGEQLTVYRFGHEAAARLQRDDLAVRHAEALSVAGDRADAARVLCALLEVCEKATRGDRPLRCIATTPVAVAAVADELARAAVPGSDAASAMAVRLPLRPPPGAREDYLAFVADAERAAAEDGEVPAAFADHAAAHAAAADAAVALRAAGVAADTADSGKARKAAAAAREAAEAAVAATAAAAEAADDVLWAAELARRAPVSPPLPLARVASVLAALAAHPAAPVVCVSAGRSGDDEDDDDDEGEGGGGADARRRRWGGGAAAAAATAAASASSGLGTRRYTVHFRNVALELQRAAIKQSLQDRHGRAAAVLVDLLLERGALDEKTACEMAMLPNRDGRETLYALTAAGVLGLQEVPKRPDHLPLYTYYLFKAELPSLLSAAVEEGHAHLLRLRLRRRLEQGRLRATCADSDGAMLDAGDEAAAAAAAAAEASGGADEGGATRAAGGGGSATDAANAVPSLVRRESAGVAKLMISELRLDAHLFLVRDLHWRLWPRKYALVRNATAGVPFGLGGVGEFQPRTGVD